MAEELYGYFGRQLRVSLGTGATTVEAIAPAVLRKYLGGVGYGAKVLYEELDAGVDPLSPANKIVFATSPLSMNTVPGGGSVMLCFKSPLTGVWGEARCGGDFGPGLRKAGFDALIVEGRSQTPVYLVIEDGQAQLRPAGHLLGMQVSEKTAAVAAEVGSPAPAVLCIGPAGENQVRIATVMVGHRAAGRCGGGAVMGAKNLLAVAVRGSRRAPVADPPGMKRAVQAAVRIIRQSDTAAGFRAHGTAGDMGPNDAAGDWPTKNWQSNSWGRGQALYDAFHDAHLIRSNGCYRGCPIACGRIADVKAGRYKTPPHEGAEYESLTAFTSFVLNEDIAAAVHATWLCNEYGIDTISAGALIAFAMECFEHGMLPDAGLDLRWGNPEVLPVLVRMMALREGIGGLLADGVRAAAQKLGNGAGDFAIHAKGLEGPAHDARSGKALAVTYGTASRGMCHIQPLEGMAYDNGKMSWGLIPHGVPDPADVDRWEEKGKGRIVKLLQDAMIVPDILDTCKFFVYAGITLDSLADILAALTGWDVDAAELIEVGERVINLQRLFNVREGLRRGDDRLPGRVLSKPAFGYYANEPRCAVADFDAMLDEYYSARQWDPATGIPSREKLAALGLAG